MSAKIDCQERSPIQENEIVPGLPPESARGSSSRSRNKSPLSSKATSRKGSKKRARSVSPQSPTAVENVGVSPSVRDWNDVPGAMIVPMDHAGDHIDGGNLDPTNAETKEKSKSFCIAFHPAVKSKVSDAKKIVLVCCPGNGLGPGPLGSFGPDKLFLKLAQEMTTACRTCRKHRHCEISVVNVVYHRRAQVEPAVEDVVVAVQWVARQFPPDTMVVLLGWSMGGAVVIEAGYRVTQTLKVVPPENCSIITLGGQSAKAGKIVALHEKTPLLILQGGADRCIRPQCGRGLYKRSLDAGKTNVFYEEFPEDSHDTETAYQFLIKQQKLLELLGAKKEK